jgi:hypothetical protein
LAGWHKNFLRSKYRKAAITVYSGFISIIELEERKRSDMTLRQAPRRHVAVVAVVLVALAVTGILIVAMWMGQLTVGIMAVSQLEITNVQFSEGYLTVTVKNTGDRYPFVDGMITEVMVQTANARMTLCKVYMNIPVLLGEQHSISVPCNWILGETYPVTLINSNGHQELHYSARAALTESIVITDVRFQFRTDAMTITAKSLEASSSVTITEVLVNGTSVSKVNVEIEAGTQISFTINYDWTSGTCYSIGLRTLRNNVFVYTAVVP